VKSTGASTSCGAVEDPRADRLTAVGAGVGVAVEEASFISSSVVPGVVPERAESLSSPSPRMARISGASTTLVLKSRRLRDSEPARTEYTTSEE